jgi:hypothetical protein
MTRSSLLLVVWLGGLVLSGCVSTGMARTLDPGRFQVSLSPSAYAAVGRSGLGSNVPAPQLEVGARYGVTERIDVGAKVFFPGVEADARFGLLRAPSLRSGVDLTLAPSVNYMGFMNSGYPWFVTLPLLIGVNHNGNQLVLGPRVAYLIQGRESRNAFLVGSSVGYSVPINPSLRFITEVSALAAPAAVAEDGLLCRVGIGLMFGGYAEEE